MKIVVEANGQTHGFECGPGENILYAGLQSGIALPYECGTGTCGTCKARLLAGEPASAWAEAPGHAGLKPGEILMCQALPGADCTVRVAAAANPMPAGACVPEHLDAVIRHRRGLTHDVVCLELELERPVDYEAGQFMVMTVPGIRGGRAYSMVNYERRTRRLTFVIKAKPGGRLSEWFFGPSVEGSAVHLFGPLGHATFHPDVARDVLCVAGGSGRGYLFFGVRTARDLFFLDELLAFKRMAPERLHVTLALSDTDVEGALVDAHPHFTFARGMVHAVAGEHMKGKFANVRAYAAGPPPMVNATLRMLLLEGRLKSTDIRYDKFS